MTAASPEQWFFFGALRFSIRAATDLIGRSPRPTHPLSVPQWAQAYSLRLIDNPDDRSIPLLGPQRGVFDRAYALGADLSVPVIVATLGTGDESVLLIDGTHQLYRAWREGMPHLPAYLLSAQETKSIREHRTAGPHRT